MTKVTLHFDLTRRLTDDDYTNIGNLHSVYGMAVGLWVQGRYHPGDGTADANSKI
mgnify:CR=1 FL=1